MSICELETVDRSVVIGYEGDRPVETEMSGQIRIGDHTKYGFEELRAKPSLQMKRTSRNR